MANVLFLFRRYKTLTIDLIIQEIYKGDDTPSDKFIKELENHILGLCNPHKSQIIIKGDIKKKNLSRTETLTLKENFENKWLKFACKPIGYDKLDDNDIKIIDKSIKDERNMILDAKIVKIFKNKRSVTENELISEMMQIKFMWVPTTNDILVRLKDIIEVKEWIKQDEKNKKL